MSDETMTGVVLFLIIALPILVLVFVLDRYNTKRKSQLGGSSRSKSREAMGRPRSQGRGAAAAARSTRRSGAASSTDLGYGLAIVGESHYQANLLEICGIKTKDGVNKFVDAVTQPEPDNPYDSNAVRVEIGGLQVGNLAERDAEHYRARFGEQALTVPANIRGGWDRKGGDVGSFGVWLHFRLYS